MKYCFCQLLVIFLMFGCTDQDITNVDNGYDVADYQAIHPRYGTMEDFQKMLDGFHERGLKFVLDVVVNHSSKEQEIRSKTLMI